MPKTQTERSIQVTICLEKETFEKLEQVCEEEDMPRSRFLNRLLKRYFEQKAI